MVSVLSGVRPNNDPVRLDQAFLGGQQMRQSILSGQQALEQGQQQLRVGEQQISRAEYEEAVQRGRVLNRLARQVREMPSEQVRREFVDRLDPELLQSVGIDPAMVSQTGLDDASLDAIIGQTNAILEDAGGDQGPKFGQVNPRDFTPESLARFQQTGNYEDLVREREFTQGGARFATGADGGVAPLVGNVETLSLADLQAEVRRRENFGATRGQEEAREQFQTPVGYRRTEDGGMELIPGSPEWRRVRDSAFQRMEELGVVGSMAETVVEDVVEALNLIESSPRATTGTGDWLARIPATEARKMRGLIMSVQSNIGFDQLLRIKRSGAGLGNVTEQQLESLASVLGRLEQAQSAEELARNLSRVERIYSEIVRTSGEDLEALKAQFEGQTQFDVGSPGAARPQQPPQPAAPAGVVNWEDLP